MGINMTVLQLSTKAPHRRLHVTNFGYPKADMCSELMSELLRSASAGAFVRLTELSSTAIQVITNVPLTELPHVRGLTKTGSGIPHGVGEFYWSFRFTMDTNRAEWNDFGCRLAIMAIELLDETPEVYTDVAETLERHKRSMLSSRR